MANIFKAQQQVNDHPNRNNFDLSKKSNVSLKFGTLYPVYCQPVVPGDSFSIDTAFNLKLMPVVFPVQTKMRAHMHYFYVRNKNLWSDWENWISNLVGQDEHPHPYISLPDSVFKNGSIHDFLGVPTSLVGSKGFSSIFFSPYSQDLIAPIYTSAFSSAVAGTSVFGDFTVQSSYEEGLYARLPLRISSVVDNQIFIDDVNVAKLLYEVIKSEVASYCILFLQEDGDYISDSSVFCGRSPLNISDFDFHGYDGTDSTKFKPVTIKIPSALKTLINSYASSDKQLILLISRSSSTPISFTPVTYDNNSVGYIPLSKDVIGYDELNLPIYSRHLHINALPYRAYESIFYAYYNNNVLNPLTINGQVQYNRYNTELGDGSDFTDYHLFQRNYELDFLTSSLPSPQQGVAPVVGMTALGDITIEDENGITTAHADIDNDGTITKVVLTSPAASNEHARTAMNIAACGMSINDFRSTNALQRVLETNIRKGYRYMDFIAGHFGKEPEYRELDMPEFIGGFSRDVSVSTVVSNADTLDAGGAALGEYGGYAQVVGGSNHSVRHYCDDYGYIIGILSVVPTPCYSQLLPKHMIAPDNFLDYYFPEMSQLGLQPITYKEVAPIQSFIDSLSDPSKSLEDTFGYQRPNYDMVSAVDEVHGEFRGSLRNYLINRIFDTRPELGQSFISINPSEINDIFVNTNPDDDTIIGEIGFSVHAKRPVPRVVIPNLGR